MRRRGDDSAWQTTAARLMALAAQAERPGDDTRICPDGRRRLARLNDCAGCHTRGKVWSLWQGESVAIVRSTDMHGFLGSKAVLSDDCVVAQHLNDENPVVEVHFGDQPPATQRHDGVETSV